MPYLIPLSPADHRRVPWKNGQGVTTELALEPAGEERFLWRVSIADVVASGPFSAFPGYDRLIAVVEGEGMRLSVDGAPPMERRRLDPAFAFPGEASVWCEPTAGPIRDVNLMLDRAGATGALTLLAGGATHCAATHCADADVVLVHALAGSLVLMPDGGEPMDIPAGHGALLRGGAATLSVPFGAEAVCAEVWRR